MKTEHIVSHRNFPGSTGVFLWLRCHPRKIANTLFFSHNFSWHWLSQLSERCHFSHIIFRDGMENAVLRGLGMREMTQMTTWKSYARKSAAFTARARSCSEILSENGEKYPEN